MSVKCAATSVPIMQISMNTKQPGKHGRISLYFEQALRVYRAHSYYAAELAWTLFRQSQSQEAAGDIQRAAKSLAEACDLYTQIAPVQTADVSPTAETFESLVPLMAR
jgi:hypothetical protein